MTTTYPLYLQNALTVLDATATLTSGSTFTSQALIINDSSLTVSKSSTFNATTIFNAASIFDADITLVDHSFTSNALKLTSSSMIVDVDSSFNADMTLSPTFTFTSQALTINDSSLIVNKAATFNANVAMASGFSFTSDALTVSASSVSLSSGKSFSSAALNLTDSLISVKQNLTVSSGKSIDATAGSNVLVPTVQYTDNSFNAVNTASLNSAMGELKGYMANMVAFDTTALENFKTLSTYLNSIEATDSTNLANSYAALLARIDWLYVSLYKAPSKDVIPTMPVSYSDGLGNTATIGSSSINATIGVGATVYAPGAVGATYGTNTGVYGGTGAIGAV
jgi:hypothetical protein